MEGRFVKPLEEKMSFKDIEEKKTQLIRTSWNLVLVVVVVFVFAVVAFRRRNRSRSK